MGAESRERKRGERKEVNVFIFSVYGSPGKWRERGFGALNRKKRKEGVQR